jgi:hypothetical protein
LIGIYSNLLDPLNKREIVFLFFPIRFHILFCKNAYGYTALYHLIVRGIERRKIFQDDQDRSQFLERVRKILRKEGRFPVLPIFMSTSVFWSC